MPEEATLRAFTLRTPPMHLIKLFLPLTDPDGNPFSPKKYDRVKRELTEGFGGVTVFSNSPAEGMWAQGDGVEFDQIIVFEIITDALSHRWWKQYKERLEHEFRQDQIMIQCHPIEIL